MKDYETLMKVNVLIVSMNTRARSKRQNSETRSLTRAAIGLNLANG